MELQPMMYVAIIGVLLGTTLILNMWGPEAVFFVAIGALAGTLLCSIFQPSPHETIIYDGDWQGLLAKIGRLNNLALFAGCGSLAGLMVSIGFKK